MFAADQKKGPLAEWLGKALQKLLQQFESARDLSGTQKSCTVIPCSFF
jgi:hypothetical protein